MQSLVNSTARQHFKVNYSRSFYYFEISLHILLLICLVELIDWPDLLLFLLLFCLISWQFFNNQSIRVLYKNDCVIQIQENPVSVSWIESDNETRFQSEEIRILLTRWFILLQLGRGKSKLNRILLVDSFDSHAHYSNFRKTVLENKLC